MTLRIDLAAEFPEAELDPVFVRDNQELASSTLAKIPAQFADAEVTDPTVSRWVRAMAARAVADCSTVRNRNPKVTRGPSLLLRGRTGTGKTHQVYGAIRALWLSGINTRWSLTTAADLLAELRPSGAGESAFARYAAVPLLCLDDLGAHAVTEWTNETLFRLVNARYEARRPLVITTNYPTAAPREGLGSPRERVETLADRVSDRVVSRLVEMTAGGWQVALTGDDRRRGGGRGLTSR